MDIIPALETRGLQALFTPYRADSLTPPYVFYLPDLIWPADAAPLDDIGPVFQAIPMAAQVDGETLSGHAVLEIILIEYTRRFEKPSLVMTPAAMTGKIVPQLDIGSVVEADRIATQIHELFRVERPRGRQRNNLVRCHQPIRLCHTR